MGWNPFSRFSIRKKHIPPEQRDSLAFVHKIRPINGHYPYMNFKDHDIVLITGDGHTLIADVRGFKALARVWDFSFDVFCVNRSLLFFEEPINHWAAVDAEESVWFSQFIQKHHGRPCRHVIGRFPGGYDMFWAIDQQIDDENTRLLWSGNSAYFAMLVSLYMGYEKIALAGCPLDRGPHWYESPNTPGPRWVGDVYTNWMDFKRFKDHDDQCRSMSGYSQFILGAVDKEWLNGH